MECKNKEVVVDGIIGDWVADTMMRSSLLCICTNDEKGKTLSITDGCIQFSIPFEPLEEYFK